MASITVKKADGVTDIVYDAVASSGGDNSPAVWRQDTGAAAGLPVGLRPTLKLTTKWNGPKTARVANIEFVYPYATEDTSTSRYSSTDRVVVNGSNVTLPQNVPGSVLNEAAAQYSNLVGSALMKSSLQTGYAPT
jgi:hypothetical protein